MAPMFRHYATLDALPVLNEMPVLSGTTSHSRTTDQGPRPSDTLTDISRQGC
jgi:hypothetical protein